jgi:hypothetical protein
MSVTLAKNTSGHVGYPHEPGRLVDCLACEAECFCNPGIGWTPDLPVTPCVYCAEQMDAFEDTNRSCGCGGTGTHGVDHGDYEDETPVNSQCSCRDCLDVSTTAAKGGWTLCRECLDAACTPYPEGTGPWPGRRPAGEYGCRRTDTSES